LSSVVAALPPDTETERVVGLLDAWFGDAGEAVASPRDVVTTLLDAARDVRTVDLRSLTTAPPSTPPWSKRAIAAFAHLASRTRSDAVRAALLPYVTPAVARAMSDDALRAWPWPSAPAVRIELMRRDDAWTSYPGMPAGANADADLPVYLRLAHGADPRGSVGRARSPRSSRGRRLGRLERLRRASFKRSPTTPSTRRSRMPACPTCRSSKPCSAVGSDADFASRSHAPSVGEAFGTSRGLPVRKRRSKTRGW
jgi:hypothetical protein